MLQQVYVFIMMHITQVCGPSNFKTEGKTYTTKDPTKQPTSRSVQNWGKVTEMVTNGCPEDRTKHEQRNCKTD
jgi:hypothetical protein